MIGQKLTHALRLSADDCPDPAAHVPDVNALASAAEMVPLVVDLDGTLIRSDLLFESALGAVRRKPLNLLRLPYWLGQGAPALKHHLAEESRLDISTLPYREELLDYLRQEKSRGRHIVLATAADQLLANAVSRELGVFDAIFASDGVDNLSGERKRDVLVAAFGERGFDYIGNSGRDLPIWAVARHAQVAGADEALRERIKSSTPVDRIFRPAAGEWREYLRELRPHQWLKNALVFLPLAASHQLFDPVLLFHAFLAFIAFTLCASSVYLLNDLLDLPADRHHPHKRFRPLASGSVGIRGACGLLAALLLAAALVGAALQAEFLLVLGFYFVTTLAYSLGLKDYAVLDVLILAGGYASRVAAGSAAAGISLSSWLLAFCIFLFFSLALLKRFAELVAQRAASGSKAHARGYVLNDAGVIAAQGIASGYLSVLVLALYTNTTMVQSLHGRYWLFWVNCLLLLYWVSYMWLMADRGRVDDDPVVFALKNPASRVLLTVMALVGLAAT